MTMDRHRRAWMRTAFRGFLLLGLAAWLTFSVGHVMQTQSDGIDIVAVSGRQRMLSQRVVSLTVQLAGSEPSEAGALRTDLLLTLETMAVSLTALQNGGPVPNLDGSPSSVV